MLKQNKNDNYHQMNNAAEFRKVREFLYSNPGANINAIIKGTGVEGKRILEYLRKGSLNLKV